MPTKFVTNPRRPAAKKARPAAKKSRVPMRRNYASITPANNFLRDLRPAQVAQMVREGSLAVTHADIGNGYYTVTLFDDGVGGENRKRVEAKWFVDGEDGWYDLVNDITNGKVDPSTADLFLGPSRWDKREREEQTRAAAKRKGIDIDASRHYFNNPTTAAKATRAPSVASLSAKVVRRAKKHGPSHPLTVEAREEFEVAARAREGKRQSRMPVEAQMWAGMLAKHNPRSALTASVEQDRLSGGWSVHIHDGRRYMDMTGDVFSTEAAAKREAKALLAQARAGVPLETLVSMFWEKHYKPFAGHELDNPRRSATVVPDNAVFYATTRGGKYEIIVTPAGEHKGEKFFDLDDRTSGESMGRGYNNLAGLRARIPDMLHYAKTWDGINYEVKVDTLGLAKKANPRRKNPPKGFRIAGPAVKTMVDGLRIGKADAQKLKDMMDTGAPRILQAAARMMDAEGVERIPGRPGLMVVNMGDAYLTTLIYDYKTNRFVVSSWGDIAERQPRRFAD